METIAKPRNEGTMTFLPLRGLKHIPGRNMIVLQYPSVREVEENGKCFGEMQRKMMEKIEELTLYIIQQEKQMAQLRDAIIQLQQKVKK